MSETIVLGYRADKYKMTSREAIEIGLRDGNSDKLFDVQFWSKLGKAHQDDYTWGYRMGVLKKLNENPLEQMVITRTNECGTCRRKGRPECPWKNRRIGIPAKDVEIAFILLCTEWEAME